MAKKCNIKGPIVNSSSKWVYNWFGIDATCPKDIESALDEAKGEDVEFAINSGGGDVYAGSEMFTLIKKYPGNTTAEVLGLAASAATLPLMAVKKSYVSPTAQVMIHNVSSGARGDYRAMQHSADVLKGWNDSIANAYLTKTGMTKEALLDIMNQETWMTAKRAVELGFVDEVMFSNEHPSLVASSTTKDTVIPEEVINKLQTLLLNNAIKLDSPPENLGDYINQLSNSAQKGADQMNFAELMASLPEDQQKLITAAMDAAKLEAKKEAETAYNAEKEVLQNKINTLENKASEDETEEALLANVDPKIKAIIDAAKQKEAVAKAAELTAQAELQKIQNEKEIAEYTNIAASYDRLPINAQEFGPIFRNFAKADGEGFENLKALLNAANNCVEKGKLFNNVGSNNKADEDVSAWDQIQKLTNEVMSKDNSLSYQAALTSVLKNNADLYEEYKAQIGGSSSVEDEE